MHTFLRPARASDGARLMKTSASMKRDYIAFMPKPDAATAAHNLAVASQHYYERHPYSAQGVPLATRVQAQDRFINSSVRSCPETRGASTN
jgi:hypothetical protein